MARCYCPYYLIRIQGLKNRPFGAYRIFSYQKRLFKDFEVYTGIKNLLNWTPAKSSPFIIARANDPFDKNVGVDNPYNLTFDPNYVYAPNQGIRGYLGIRYTLNK